MDTITFSNICPLVAVKLRITPALVGGYIAGNVAGYCPNIQGIATYLNLDRSVVSRAVKKLEKSGWIAQNELGQWYATQQLIDQTAADSYIVYTNILTNRELKPVERLLLGYLSSGSDHSLDTTVCATGIKATCVNNCITALSDKGLITKVADGGGRGHKRHYTTTYSINAQRQSEGADAEDDEEMQQYLAEAEQQLVGCRQSVNPVIRTLAVRILAEINAADATDTLTVRGELMQVADVWALTGRIDRSVLAAVADRLDARWYKIGDRKAYLRAALLQEAKMLGSKE